MQKNSFTNKKIILFDLDGTIIDSKEGIFNSIKHTVNTLRLDPISEETMDKFIGPSIGSSFRRFLNMNDADADNATNIYRSYYRDIGINQCTVYDGLAELAAILKQQGKLLGVATKKPQVFSEKIILDKGLSQYFDCICGSSLSEASTGKSHIIEMCAKSLIANTEYTFDDAVHIGDTNFDISGAREAGIESIGVLYGFGTRASIEAEQPTCIAADMKDLTKILTK